MVMPGYYFYKQVSRAGQPGMAVARVVSNDACINLIAFAGNGSGHPGAFVVINVGDADVALNVQVDGSASATFTAYRTSPTESYIPLGDCALKDDHIACAAPAGSVMTFFGQL